MSQTETQRTHPRSKAGCTLLVKPSKQSSYESVFSGFEGHQSTFHTEKTNTYFVRYQTPQQALSALKSLKTSHGRDMRVKFAQYRVFFKLDGLTNETDYNTVKSAHTQLVLGESGANMLYYRLYRKNDSYLGCGDFTVDTKECFDNLMNSEGLKNFTLDGMSGVHYRYKRNQQSNATTNGDTE
jgi:hypothetical protein